MPRYSIQGTFQDGNGRRVEGGTISFFLADTTTPADVYAAKSGGTSVNTVLTDSAGGFIAYVDDSEYTSSQFFDLSLSKTNFVTKYVYDIKPIAANEGTWTPVLKFGGATTGITYSIQGGHYTKFGETVFCSGSILLTDKGSATGDARIYGLPFALSNDFNYMDASAPLRIVNVSFADRPQAYAQNGDVYIRLEESLNDGTVTNLTNANFANDSAVIFTITYKTE